MDFFFGGHPCDHAATMSSTFDLKVPQIQFNDSCWIFLLFAETGTHSGNCAVLRRDSSGAVLGLVVGVPVVVQRQVRSLLGNVVDISVVAQRQFPLVLFRKR